MKLRISYTHRHQFADGKANFLIPTRAFSHLKHLQFPKTAVYERGYKLFIQIATNTVV